MITDRTRIVMFTLLLSTFCWKGAGLADDQGPSAGDQAKAPRRWLLLACGLPGDDGHRERLTDACAKIIRSVEPVLGVTSPQLRVLVGDETMLDDLKAESSNLQICTAESMEQTMHLLSQQIAAEDECWVWLLGHSHLYGGRSQFNVQGKDFDQTQFATWTRSLKAKTQVFVLTMPVTGYWIKPLAGDARVIISATEADLEVTATEMPYALADVLSGEAEFQPLADIDGDGRLSLLDLYLAVSLEIAARFRSLERLQTEHALLEDNGDGRGSELQQPYLPVEDSDDTPVENASLPPLIETDSLDGFRSRQILLSGTSP